ncbi:MAG TPA: hypothetical protein VFN97_15770 [Actinospica sp.]|nr:hypothetical protein [Actinospica sp.]
MTDTDVLIVGGGILGAVVARLLREGDPALRISMVDGCRPIGGAPGVHLHADPLGALRAGDRMATRIFSKTEFHKAN